MNKSNWIVNLLGRMIVLCCVSTFLLSCGFHLQGQIQLPQPLHRLYLQTPDPYGVLAKSLQQYLKMSMVDLTASPQEAETILVILRDDEAQNLLSVSGTQQTRQYELRVTVLFEILDRSGRVLVPPQALIETRQMTVQSNQILGSNNEVNLFYQQMRRALASAIMDRIASNEIKKLLTPKLPAIVPAKSAPPLPKKLVPGR